MLVVISDLHFEEETSDIIPAVEDLPTISFSRNLHGRSYRSFAAHLAGEAQRNGAKRLDLVLAGDIFDIHRTSLWFSDNEAGAKPYVRTDRAGKALEEQVLKILRAIQNEPGVHSALEVFQLLGSGRYWDVKEREFPVPVKIHYLPGNHDRLADATARTRLEVRNALGMESSGEPFPHVLLFPREGAMIRHGHEYDRHNFAADLNEEEIIPTDISAVDYKEPPFGDFATVDIASHIPLLFREYHGDKKILSDSILRNIYQRLLEFDDLRPQLAMLNFLLHMPKKRVDPTSVWKAIVPILLKLLETLHDDPFLQMWLERMDKKWQLDTIDVIQTALALKSWRLVGIPLGLAQFVSRTAIEGLGKTPSAARLAAREEAIQSGDLRFVIAGHTHSPATELIASDRYGERYYIDTGTWRNRLPATPDFKAFGRLKALTYVIVYGPDEDLGESRERGKLASVDFWSGITQRWHKAAS